MSVAGFEDDYVRGLAASELEPFEKRAMELLDHMNNDKTELSMLAGKLRDFYSIAELFVMAEQEEEDLAKFREVVLMVNKIVAKKKSQRLSTVIDLPLTKRIFLVAALVQKSASIEAHGETEDIEKQAGENLARMPWSSEESAVMEHYVLHDLIGAPLDKLLKMSGITSQSPETIFDMEALKKNLNWGYLSIDVSDKRKLEQATKFFLESNPMLPGSILGVTDMSEEAKRILGKEGADELLNPLFWDTLYQAMSMSLKPEVMGAVSDTIGKILATYVNTTNRLYLYRGVHFKSEEERDRFISEAREHGIEKKQQAEAEPGAIKYDFISTTAFKEIADKFTKIGISDSGEKIYSAIITMEVSKVEVTQVRYTGVDSSTSFVDTEPLLNRIEGEFRIKDKIPKAAIISIEAVNPE